jgi:hypothetical protein
MGDGRSVRSIRTVYADFPVSWYYIKIDVARRGCVTASAPCITGLGL